MQTLGVPYAKGYAEQAETDLKNQAVKIAEALSKEGYPVESSKEIIAMIAYLQRLGTDIKLSSQAAK
jgi:cytochrome c oxidase cbb3-type subunit I/II